MTIGEIVRQGFYYAHTCRWLWLFGFFVGIASGGSSGGGRGGNGDGGGLGGGLFFDLSAAQTALLIAGILLVVAAVTVLRFVGEGALIEGVVRARGGRTMTTREGFRAGWAHWGVLLRIALLYLAATAASVALFVAPWVLALRAFGPLVAIPLAMAALVIAVPWLATLYLVQAFASRIAVLENRRAFDAIGRARLFLHGRLRHGLKLLVATFLGTFALLIAGTTVMLAVALLLLALLPVLRVFAVIALACVVLSPVVYVFAAMVGTFRSSIWTIGYLTQVEA
jgi:hypothetical protein